MTDAIGAAAHDRQVARDLDLLRLPPPPWTSTAFGPDGAAALDVVVVGAGMYGIAAAAALVMKGIRVLMLDRAPNGQEGPWITYARMETLRSPKHLPGIALGIPSLTYRAWHEARFGAAAWDRHLARLAAMGWQVEVQAEAGRLPAILPPLLRAGVPVVVDHFGRPDPRLGVGDPGFRHLLDTGATGRVWVKLSGAYRNGDAGAGERTALTAAPLLLAAFGPGRLLWGSDWPHTQFETVASPAAARRALDAWVPDETDRRVVLADAPARLFRFND